MSPDLATAEAWLREVAAGANPNSTSQHAFTRTGVALHVLLRDLDRLRALRQQLWEMCGRPDGFGLDAELIDAVGDLRYPAGGVGPCPSLQSDHRRTCPDCGGPLRMRAGYLVHAAAKELTR